MDLLKADAVTRELTPFRCYVTLKWWAIDQLNRKAGGTVIPAPAPDRGAMLRREAALFALADCQGAQEEAWLREQIAGLGAFEVYNDMVRMYIPWS